jgi:hypothetical protein
MTTDKETKRPVRNQEALLLLEDVLAKVRENPDATEVFILAKIGAEYHRFSSGITNLMKLVATLELAKFDALQRMSDD